MENLSLSASFTSHGKKLVANSHGLMVLTFTHAITFMSLGLLPLLEIKNRGKDRVILKLNAS